MAGLIARHLLKETKMKTEQNNELTTYTFNESEIGLSVRETYLALLQEISTNPDAVSGSFVFDMPNGVAIEVTITRT